MRITFVTSNVHKVDEVRPLFARKNIELDWKAFEIAEPALECLSDIAAYKAREAFFRVREPVLVEDTGIFFRAYDNFPGPLPKRMFQALGFKGLLKLLENDRRAYFETRMVFFDGKRLHESTGRWHGTIVRKVSSRNARNAFPYERIFVPKGQKECVSALRVEEKNRASHRAKAARKMAAWLSKTALE